MSVRELWCEDPARANLTFDAGRRLFSFRRFFTLLDRALHRLGALTQRRPLRARALREAERWIRERQDRNGGWGGIVPAMLNSTLALYALHGSEDDAVRRGHQAIEDFTVQLPQGLMFQPCVSPVWDTVLAIKSLLDSGAAPDDARLVRGAEWLLDRQILGVRGDWARKRPDAKPGGWAFEYENVHYPDVDDTVAIATTLDRLTLPDEVRKHKAVQRGLRWTLNMQSTNGGWGAFDVDNVRDVWNEIPFADMKAMLDAPTADLTGRGLELLGHFGYSLSSRQAERALAFVTARQEADGSFWGRWGVNYIYGTWSVLTGLARLGFRPDDPRVRRAADWLEKRQNKDGGFGESPASYAGSLRVRPRAFHPFPDRLGGDGSHCRSAAGGASPSGAESSICSLAKAGTASGPRMSGRERGSPAISICAITAIPAISRFPPSAFIYVIARALPPPPRSADRRRRRCVELGTRARPAGLCPAGAHPLRELRSRVTPAAAETAAFPRGDLRNCAHCR